MKQKKLVIIGGGFAGSIIAKKLEHKFETTLIDKKSFFEFTPGILRAIVDPKHLRKLHVNHKDYLKTTTCITDVVTKIAKTHVETSNKNIPFDYLVVATGSSYHPPIKSHSVVNSSNAQMLQNHHNELQNAKKVLIVGGGNVGVELAAEIGEVFCKDIKQNEKEISLVESQNKLMSRENKKACEYAETFLNKCGINILFKKRFGKEDVKDYDLVFFATGIKPNTDFLPNSYCNDFGFIEVKNTLQIKKHENVFAAGDVVNIKEEKLAQTAEKHAAIVVQNILACENGKKLKNYESSSKIKIISLGKYKGIMTYKGVTFVGFFPGLFKGLLERFYVTSLKFA